MTSVHELEASAVSMTSNQNVMFVPWNSTGSSFFGTGFCFTSNGGLSWSGNYNNMNPSMNGGYPGSWIWPATSSWSGRLGVSVLNYNSTAVVAFYSTDNGSTWSLPATLGGSSPDKTFSCVDDISGSPFFGRAYTLWTDFAGSNANRIVGAYSTNGGTSWTGYSPVSPAPVTNHLCTGCDLCVGPGGVLYAVWSDCILNGSFRTEDSLGFAKSTDGGVSWVVSKNNVLFINGIHTDFFLATQILVNSYPRIAIDKSGGSRNGWIYVVYDEKYNTPALDSADVILCRSTNGGNNWTKIRVNQDPAGAQQWMPSLCVAPNGGVAVGYYDNRGLVEPVTQYYVSYSNSGGNNWSDVLVSDHTFTLTHWYWQTSYYGEHTGMTYSNNKFFPFWMDRSTGYYQIWTCAVTLDGISNNTGENLKSFYLYQNYPNPFNPATKIKFDVPKSNNVTIKIFNILGKEIVTLVNDKFPPGTYEADWDAKLYSSGIYFCKMTAGKFLDIKRMMFIK
jgi:hypothetical protein